MSPDSRSISPVWDKSLLPTQHCLLSVSQTAVLYSPLSGLHSPWLENLIIKPEQKIDAHCMHCQRVQSEDGCRMLIVSCNTITVHSAFEVTKTLLPKQQHRVWNIVQVPALGKTLRCTHRQKKVNPVRAGRVFTWHSLTGPDILQGRRC